MKFNKNILLLAGGILAGSVIAKRLAGSSEDIPMEEEIIEEAGYGGGGGGGGWSLPALRQEFPEEEAEAIAPDLGNTYPMAPEKEKDLDAIGKVRTTMEAEGSGDDLEAPTWTQPADTEPQLAIEAMQPAPMFSGFVSHLTRISHG